jgi:hypothetical protein
VTFFTISSNNGNRKGQIAMEKIKMTKNSPKYGFKKGDELVVKRNIRNECVIIMDDENIPNLILSEHKLRSYGTLTGTPQLCFH